MNNGTSYQNQIDRDSIDIKAYLTSLNNYVNTLKANPVRPTPSVTPFIRNELLSIDDKVNNEIKVLNDIDKIHNEIEKILLVSNAPKNRRGLISLKYSVGKYIPGFKGTDATISELLLMQSIHISKACDILDAHTKKYDMLSESLSDFEERLYSSSEALAARKDNLEERLEQSKDVLEFHLNSKTLNPTEKERNSWILTRNRMYRGITDLETEQQLSNQQYVLNMDQAVTLSQMIGYMKAQSAVCKTITILGRTSADYFRETARIHDTAESMQISSADVISKITLAGRVVEKLGEARHMRQQITIEKAKAYIGNEDGSGYRRMLEAPTREAQELSKLLQKNNEKTMQKIYESEY